VFPFLPYPNLLFEQPESGGTREASPAKGDDMLWLLILLIIVVIVVFGLGFVVEWLFWIALALFLIWIITLLVRLIRGR